MHANRRPSPARGVDPARIVVILLGVGALIAVISVVFATAKDPTPPGAGENVPVSTEAKVFEGRRYKYKLRTPAGTPWRALPDVLVGQRAQGADMGIERAGGGAVAVITSEVTPLVTMESVLNTILSVQSDGIAVEELSRTPVEKGEDKGIFVRARRTGSQPAEMFVLAIARDGVLYLVTGASPSPSSDALVAEMSGIVQDFEPPPPEDLSQPPAPPLVLLDPGPAGELKDPSLSTAAAPELIKAARVAASQARFAEAAAILYGAVTRAKADVRYDLASYESAAGRVDAGLFWIQRAALEEGVDADWAEDDQDLAALRRDPRWPTVRSFLRKTQRYWAKRPSNTEVVAIPRGYAAGKPIPLVVALHGLGSSPEDFAEGWMQKAADALSVAIVSVSGTEVRGPHSYAWAEDIERDRARIERAVSNLGDRVTVAPGKIVLAGFSQGGQMSAELAARFPDRYAGAIAMSPGTRRELRLKGIAGGSLAGHRFVVLVGEGEHPGNIERARADAEALRAAGGDAYYHAYPELRTHARPPDFEKAFPSWVRFVLDGKPL